MKKFFYTLVIGIQVLLIGGHIAEATPEYSNQTTSEYFKELYNEAIANGFQDINQARYNIIDYKVTKINREIVGAEYNFPAQFYMGYTDYFFSSTSGPRKYPDEQYSGKGESLQDKLNIVKDANKGQSQFMFPWIKTRMEARFQWEDYGLIDAPVGDAYFDRKYQVPQGFMYAEANSDGSNTKVKQFVYGKDLQHFQVLWNPSTESLMYIAWEVENGRDSNKIMVMLASPDTAYRYIKVSGELFYFGNDNKRFTVLNQMAYHTGGLNQEAYLTYGNGLGFSMPDKENKASVVIRTDVEDGPENWFIKEYPYQINRSVYNNAPGEEASKPANFLKGFKPETIDGLGMESELDFAGPGKELTKANKQEIRWDAGKQENYIVGPFSFNSIKLKSKSINLDQGQSMKLAYGYEPTTLYTVPTIGVLSEMTKNDNEPLERKVKWIDSNKESEGGKIEYYVNDKFIGVEDYHKEDPFGVVDGYLDLKIESEHFISGVDNTVKLVIKDKFYDLPGIIQEEHTSTRSFVVKNKRVIPINYKSTNGKELEVPQGTVKEVALMDDVSTEVMVPDKLTDKAYPLIDVEPKKNPNISRIGNKITIKGNKSLKEGITVIYKILEVEATIKFLNSNDQPILKDIKGEIPTSTYQLPNLEVGKSLEEALSKAKANMTMPLELNYIGYTLRPGYKVSVNGVEPADKTVIPDSDFDIEFKYDGETSLVTVPEIKFSVGNISNDSTVKQPLEGDNTMLEMHDTLNTTDTKITLSLASQIVNGDKQVYGGEIRYKAGVAGEEDVSLTTNSSVVVMNSTKDKHFNSISLKNSDTTQPNIYMVQYPGNYDGNYEASLLWKLEPNTTKEAAK